MSSGGQFWMSLDTRHQGVDAARGDYVVQLDDDDLFAPTLIQECACALDANPSLEAVFIGVKGFGRSADHFDRTHATGTARVVDQGRGRPLRHGTWAFDAGLFDGLLNQVPMPFQRVMGRRSAWQGVSRLRLAAYQVALNLSGPDAARGMIRGTLRDSEWALYAALACHSTILIDEPLYLQRCDGQGRSSRADMVRSHIDQGVLIRTVLAHASRSLPELRRYRRTIAKNLANSHMDAAYAFISLGQYPAAWHHLMHCIRLDPRLKAGKLMLKLALSWALPARAV